MAVRHLPTDRVPRGELLVEEAFLDRLHPERVDAPYREKMADFVEEMGLDLVTVGTEGQDEKEGLQALREWAVRTECFVMALVDGLFWRSCDPVSFEAFVLGLCKGQEAVRDLIRAKKQGALRRIQRCLDAGAHGVIIGDDLAYNRGPYVSPKDLGEWIFPGLQEMAEAVKEGGGIAFLHSCGNLTGIMDGILSCGFDGLHGLAPSAGNDPLTVRGMTRGRLALMGVFDVDSLPPRELKAVKEETLPILAAGGGYILGSSGGLSGNTPPDAVRALYA